MSHRPRNNRSGSSGTDARTPATAYPKHKTASAIVNHPNARGITCVLLKYRVPDSGRITTRNAGATEPGAPLALQNAQCANRVRSHDAGLLNRDYRGHEDGAAAALHLRPQQAEPTVRRRDDTIVIAIRRKPSLGAPVVG